MALTSLIEGDAGADAGATCAGITFTAGSASRTGSDVFNSDMTYEVTGTGTAHVNVFYPASCLGGETCAEVSSQLGAQAGFSSVSCTGTGSCTCAAVVTVPLADTGTYTVSGNTLNLDSTTSGPSTQSFCVQGDTLHLVDIDTTMNMGPMGMATIDDDDVLTKQ